MLVKVFIKRHFKEGKTKEINALLNEFRAGAMNRPGYVSGETLLDPENPNKVLVIGTWQNMESWQSWKENSARKKFEAMLEIYQHGSTEYEAYLLGKTL
jgi:quinol monooxygenase YgiN